MFRKGDKVEIVDDYFYRNVSKQRFAIVEMVTTNRYDELVTVRFERPNRHFFCDFAHGGPYVLANFRPSGLRLISRGTPIKAAFAKFASEHYPLTG